MTGPSTGSGRRLPPLDEYGPEAMDFITTWEAGQAAFLGALLLSTYKPRAVIDLGCGPGIYLLPFRAAGCAVLGVDADAAAGQALAPDEFRRADLRQPVGPPFFADVCLCIEVGEHLYAEYAHNLVFSATLCGRVVVWSAATPGQGGQHHHNEQPVEYWEALFRERGYWRDPFDAVIRAAIQANAECQKVGWLTRNVLVVSR